MTRLLTKPTILVTSVAATEERALSEYKEEKKNQKPLIKVQNPTKNNKNRVRQKHIKTKVSKNSVRRKRLIKQTTRKKKKKPKKKIKKSRKRKISTDYYDSVWKQS